MGKEARTGYAATMGVHQFEDFACLLGRVTALLPPEFLFARE
jgi:hypothetical protein